jgi:hypothetical protein
MRPTQKFLSELWDECHEAKHELEKLIDFKNFDRELSGKIDHLQVLLGSTETEDKKQNKTFGG